MPKNAAPTNPASRRSLSMAFCYAPFGLLAGLWTAMHAQDRGFGYFWLYAGAAAFLSGFVVWRLTAGRKPTPGRGLVAGLLAGLVCCWLCWYLMILRAWLLVILLRRDGAAADPFHALWGARLPGPATALPAALLLVVPAIILGFVLGGKQAREAPPAA